MSLMNMDQLQYIIDRKLTFIKLLLLPGPLTRFRVGRVGVCDRLQM